MIADQPGLQQPASTVVGRGLVEANRIWRVLAIVVLVVVAVVMLMPFVWLVSSSLKPQTQIFQFPPVWIPNPPRFENYTEALTYKPFHLYLRNSMIIVAFNEVAILGSASICAYGFARIRFWGREFWFALVLGTLMLPYIVLVVPTVKLFSTQTALWNELSSSIEGPLYM